MCLSPAATLVTGSFKVCNQKEQNIITHSHLQLLCKSLIYSQFSPSRVKVLLSVLFLARRPTVRTHWSRTPRPGRHHLTDTDQISMRGSLHRANSKQNLSKITHVCKRLSIICHTESRIWIWWPSLTSQDNREVPTTGHLLNSCTPRQRAELKGYDLWRVTEP